MFTAVSRINFPTASSVPLPGAGVPVPAGAAVPPGAPGITSVPPGAPALPSPPQVAGGFTSEGNEPEAILQDASE